RVPVLPFVRLGLEDHVIGIGPREPRIHGGEFLVVFLVVPELLRVAARRVSDPERQGVAAGERRVEQTGARVVAPRLLLAAAASRAGAAAPAQRGERVVRRAVRVADAPRSTVRLLTERRAGA